MSSKVESAHHQVQVSFKAFSYRDNDSQMIADQPVSKEVIGLGEEALTGHGSARRRYIPSQTPHRSARVEPGIEIPKVEKSTWHISHGAHDSHGTRSSHGTRNSHGTNRTSRNFTCKATSSLRSTPRPSAISHLSFDQSSFGLRVTNVPHSVINNSTGGSSSLPNPGEGIPIKEAHGRISRPSSS